MLKNVPNRGLQLNGYQWPYIELSEFRDLLNTKHRCIMCNEKRKIRKGEHIIPNWILDYCDIFSGTLNITDTTRRKLDSNRLSTYKIRLCVNCNGALGDIYEHVIAPPLKKEADEAREFVEANSALVFCWANFIVFKNSFVEMDILTSKDRRKNLGFLGGQVDWDVFHTVHAKARAPLYGTSIHPSLIGTWRLFHVTDADQFGEFYYFDDPSYPIFIIRIKRIALIWLLDDFGFVDWYLSDLLNDVDNEVTNFELTEILTEMHLARMRMKADHWIRHSFERLTGHGEILSHSVDEAFFRPSSLGEKNALLHSHISAQLRCSEKYSQEAFKIASVIDRRDSPFLKSKYVQRFAARTIRMR